MTTQNMGFIDLHVTVHREDDTYWADSGGWRGWTVAADTWTELMTRIQESVDLWRPGTTWMAVGDAEFSPPSPQVKGN